MDERRFDSEKLAEFEAYMAGLFPLKDGESGSFRLATLSDAKEEIKSVISKGEYEVAGNISDKLSKPIEFTLEERTKSLRVPFSEYARLVYEALTEGIALSDAVKRRVIASLENAIKTLSAREGISKEKLSLLKKEVSAWSEVHAEKRKSYAKRRKSEVEPSGRKDEYKTEPVEEPHADYYRPFYLFYGEPPVEALRQLIVESEVKEHSNVLPLEVLHALFGATRTELERLGVLDISESFDIVIRKVGDRDMKIEFTYSDYLMTEEAWVELDKSFPDFDDEVMEKIRHLSELADDEAFCHSARAVIASIDMRINRNGVCVGDLSVTENEYQLKKGLLEKLAPTADEDRVKGQISEALDKNDMIKVTELTRELRKKKEEREVIDFALNTIVPLIKRTQSVSFRAPDLLIRAWDAYGNIGVGSSIEGKEGED